MQLQCIEFQKRCFEIVAIKCAKSQVYDLARNDLS